MMLAPLLGALLLWLTDQLMVWLALVWRKFRPAPLPALIGAPLLLWLLPRLRSAATPPPMNLGDRVPAERQHLPRWLLPGRRAAAGRAGGGADAGEKRRRLALERRRGI
ncbi:Iron(III)-hydroxamate import system permease protein fhuB [Serratia rubidaea]|uniref:Iron(III)-hydroxamate import system permease protein fhuB n=1 Tax=Serratia rubidaea TaxID=61652 RepID=A0A4U9HS42_SERRU|nr:Iron(III)-hydroxamate import system permease protein fhuB [Serratia rubidaea]